MKQVSPRDPVNGQCEESFGYLFKGALCSFGVDILMWIEWSALTNLLNKQTLFVDWITELNAQTHFKGQHIQFDFVYMWQALPPF